MSGQYAHTHGVVNNFTEYPASLASFPAVLQRAGYESAYIGKWHMGENNDERRPGFDYWVSHKGQGKYNDTEFNINGKRETKNFNNQHGRLFVAQRLHWIEFAGLQCRDKTAEHTGHHRKE